MPNYGLFGFPKGLGLENGLYGLPREIRIWTPDRITTELWFSYADSTSLSISSGKITEWAEKSGNARNISQVTLAKQPTDNNGVEFDGISQELTTSSTFTISTTTNTFFIVERGLNGATGAAPFSFDTGTTGSGIIFQRNVNMQPWSSNAAVPYNQTTGRILSSQQGTTGQGYVNGTQITQNSTIGAGAYTATNFTLGKRVITNLFTSGVVLEIIVIPTALTTEIRQNIEGYLAYIYGLQSVLPSDHPYKVNPPYI